MDLSLYSSEYGPESLAVLLFKRNFPSDSRSIQSYIPWNTHKLLPPTNKLPQGIKPCRH